MTRIQQLQREYSSATTPPPEVWTIQTPGTDLGVHRINKFIRAVLDDRSADDVRNVRVVASEYATNALTHSASGVGGRIKVDLEVDDDGVTVRVHDDGPRTGAATDVERDADHGRGLDIVKALSIDCGETFDDAKRRSAWARIDAPRTHDVRREERADPPAYPDGAAARTETGAPQPAHSACDPVPPCPPPREEQA